MFIWFSNSLNTESLILFWYSLVQTIKHFSIMERQIKALAISPRYNDVFYFGNHAFASLYPSRVICDGYFSNVTAPRDRICADFELKIIIVAVD